MICRIIQILKLKKELNKLKKKALVERYTSEYWSIITERALVREKIEKLKHPHRRLPKLQNDFMK